jgi:hypothetical protein
MSTEQRSRFAVATLAYLELPHGTSRAVLLAIAVPLIGSFFLAGLPLVFGTAYARLLIILYVAIEMMYREMGEVWSLVALA